MNDGTCSVLGCERQAWARELCNAHYRRWRENGDPGAAVVRDRIPGRKCKVEGCDRDHVCRGMCRSHYARWRNNGDPGTAEFRVYYDVTARDEQGRKRCPSCEEWLAVEKFGKHASTTDGLSKRCRNCERKADLKRNFHLTVEQYKEMLHAQGGCCAICSNPPDGDKWLAVDHDHACCPEKGKSCGQCVRALLCGNCNTAIGMMSDDAERLEAAATYLRKYAA